MNKNIRTRFAPSPTGHLHIGNARTAIMNWIFARHAGGRFILRIEDTDRERSTESSEKAILEDLCWLGLDWDEGPDKPGDFGPYHQSERIQLYQNVLAELIRKGRAYPCYCTPEELEAYRKSRIKDGLPPNYSGTCRELSVADQKQFESKGKIPSFRFRVEQDEASFDDLIKGPIQFDTEILGDFILVRPDGMPMYNFACVVDDHYMEISHVIRGDDHVSNTPRQVVLYRALNWDLPAFAHIPMILGNDRQRLSKRHGATSVAQYREKGYLPEALVNFLSLLSWSSESGEEILSLDQLIQEFDFSRVGRASSVFDVEKLNWMNGVYIRNLDVPELSKLIRPFMVHKGYPDLSEEDLQAVISLLHEKAERLDDIAEKAGIFFREPVPENDEAREVLAADESKTVFRAFLDETVKIKSWSGDTFLAVMKQIQEKTGVKGKQLWMPVRVALTGQCHGPELPGVVNFMGLDKCRKYVEEAL